jgi:hypothetical protein
MIFSSSDFTMDQSHLVATQNRASRRSLQNETVEIKTWVRTTEYHLIQQTPGIRCTVTFPGGAFRNSTLWPDLEGPALGRSPSLHKRNPRTTTFIENHASSPKATDRWLRRRGTDKKPNRECPAARHRVDHQTVEARPEAWAQSCCRHEGYACSLRSLSAASES